MDRRRARALAALRLLELARRRVEELWRPNPGPQAAAYDCEAFELLYGGAAGGGKTDLIIALARQRHRSSLLLRRTYPMLEDSIIKRSVELYGQTRCYNESKHVWRFPEEGRRIRLGNLQREKDVEDYRSAQFDLICFDELTQFTALMYAYLRSRARSTVPGQRVRMVSATNPGGEGQAWVIEYWAPWIDPRYSRPARPGELRWFRRTTDGRSWEETGPDDPKGTSRTFIQALLKDNPHLGDDYERILEGLPEPFRSQLLKGDWTAGATDDPYQVIPSAWVTAAQERWKAQGGPREPMTALGCDVAHGGEDRTTFAARHGSWVAMPEEFPGAVTPDGRSVVALLQERLKDGAQCNMDAQPPSAFDTARMFHLPVSGINFGGRNADARDKSGLFAFANVRAEMYWRLREALDPAQEGGATLALPPHPELLADLTAPRWSVSLSGIQLEPKDGIKKRLGRSPDVGEAVVLACYTGASAGLLEHYRELLKKQREAANGTR